MTSFDSELDSLISRHINNIPSALIEYWKQDYKEDNVVKFKELLPTEFRENMESEAILLISQESKRREMIVEESGRTPRAYSSVGRDIIRERARYIPAFFDSPTILQFLSRIAGEPIHRVPYAPEEFVVNSQSRSGDTHGWHWDDYAFAFIWVVEEPDVLKGGRVEFIPHIPWKKANTREWLRYNLAINQISSQHVAAGECYLMKANSTLHRVSPLTDETRRTVIVFAYASTSDLTDESITHASIEAIYPDDSANFEAGRMAV